MEDLKRLTNEELDEMLCKTQTTLHILQKEERERSLDFSDENIGKYFKREYPDFTECVKLLAYNLFERCYRGVSCCIYYTDSIDKKVEYIEFENSNHIDLYSKEFEEITKEEYENHLEEALKAAKDICDSRVTYHE